MVDSPQDVYARNLSSHYGYPLRRPEPNIELPDNYRREGLKIGDVGVVAPEGSFDVFFNITLPQEHPLHAADGVPNNFTQVVLRREDFRIAPDAEGPGRVISPPNVNCTVSCVDPFFVDGTARRLSDHQFSLQQDEGGMLILPQGAEHHRLAKDLLLLDAVLQNAVEWYRFARETLYQNIASDGLYLITGFHKALSWSLASYKNSGASSAQCKIVQTRRAGSMLSDDSAWETIHPLDWRIGPRHTFGVANQCVFITGFKIAVNTELLYMQRVKVMAGHSKRTIATTLVGFGASLANILPWATSRMVHFSEAATREQTNESILERDPSGDEPERVAVERVPQMSQPFHPSDIINRYMLKKEPSAKVAVTHDSQWIVLLERGKLKQQDMLQEGRLEAAVSQEYDIIVKNEVVYLQGKDMLKQDMLQQERPEALTSRDNIITKGTVNRQSIRYHHQAGMVPNSGNAQHYPHVARNVVFIGETGTGKSSVTNLLLKTGPLAPISNDSQPYTQTCARYETTFNGTKYALWDTLGLGEDRSFFRSLFEGNSEKELKKFLKERHIKQEIDLLVFCIRGSRATEASGNHYKKFCAITRKLAAPVVVVVTHLEKEVNMEDWWSRNSACLEELGMEFDDHVCITTLAGHPRLAESRDKLIQMVTKSHQWRVKDSGSYFGSPVSTRRPTATSAPLRKAWTLSRVFGVTGNANFDDESLSRRSSTCLASFAPSTAGSYHTADSPAASTVSSPIVEPPTPRGAVTVIKVPYINTNQLGPGDPPQSHTEETSSSASSAQSMFHSGSPSSHTSYSDRHTESCTEENEGSSSELPIRLPTAAVKRRKPWASKSGAYGDVWECDLICGGSSRVVAVKVARINTDSYKDMSSQQKELRREFRVWVKLQHKNIVPLLGVVSDFGPFPSAVSPWFHNGSLSNFLVHHEASKSERHRLLGDIAVGLRYLHSQGVVHGDLHSDHVLIDDDGTACITGFGLSFISDFIGTSYLKSNICGVMQFADPALFRRAYSSRDSDNVFYPTKPCDIYSFGGLILHVSSGKKPYDGIPSPTLVVTLIDGKRPQIPTDDNRITPWHKSLIRRCWDPEEYMRPSADELARMFDR